MQDWLKYVVAIIIGACALWFAVRMLSNRYRRWRFTRRYEDAETVETMMNGQIARGMTLDMVLDVWGQPADMDEVVMKTKTKRELKYDQKGKNRFGTRVYLENGVVVGWETK
jgi:hypothetical protein